MPNRDWQRDMEICQKASPGPWRVRSVTANTNYDDELYMAEIWNDEKCIAEQVRLRDAKLIVQSREGWPAALGRVTELEAAIKHCIDVECRKCYNYGTCDKETSNGCGIYELKEVISNA